MEIIANNGDLYRIRPCTEEPCVVVELFRNTGELEPAARANLLRQYGVELPPAEPNEPEPHESWHLPADVIPSLVEALTEAANGVVRDEEEED
jgi:hypothetical protein